jgi:hypothetical protein
MMFHFVHSGKVVRLHHLTALQPHAPILRLRRLARLICS